MLNKLNRQLLSLFTLLTLLLQSTVFSGQAMAQMTDKNQHTVMTYATSHCADSQKPSIFEDDCCSSKLASKTCCEGRDACSGDCSHCLTISITGTLLIDVHWPVEYVSNSEISIFITHFYSISLASEIRPPIV